jgi:hypothetical protein
MQSKYSSHLDGSRNGDLQSSLLQGAARGADCKRVTRTPWLSESNPQIKADCMPFMSVHSMQYLTVLSDSSYQYVRAMKVCILTSCRYRGTGTERYLMRASVHDIRDDIIQDQRHPATQPLFQSSNLFCALISPESFPTKHHALHGLATPASNPTSPRGVLGSGRPPQMIEGVSIREHRRRERARCIRLVHTANRTSCGPGLSTWVSGLRVSSRPVAGWRRSVVVFGIWNVLYRSVADGWGTSSGCIPRDMSLIGDGSPG